jgi:hypothetical protein
MVGAAVAIDGSASHDPGGQLISFQWAIASAPPGSVAALDSSDPAPAFTPDVPGIYRLQLVVTTEDGWASRPATMTIAAFDVRPAPNARAGRDREARVGSLLRLDASSSFDPLNTPLTFHWSMISASPASLATDSTILLRDSETPLFRPDTPGPFVIGLAASNGELATEDRVTITATDGNLPPIANAGDDQLVRRAGPISLHGEASSDPDGGPAQLAYAWQLVARPAGSTLEGSAIRNANLASASVTLDAPGAYVFRLTVSDGEGSDADNVLVRLEADQASDAASAASADMVGTNSKPVDANSKPGAEVVGKATAKRATPNFTLLVRPSRLRIAAGSRAYSPSRCRQAVSERPSRRSRLPAFQAASAPPSGTRPFRGIGTRPLRSTSTGMPSQEPIP